MVQESSESRMRQIVSGVVLLVLITVVVCGLLAGWRFLPGLLGDWIGTMMGVMTTPFLLEGSFVILGFCVVIWLNHRRELREGSEWVVLERVDDPGEGQGMPEQARWAILPDGAPIGEEPGLTDLAEGAAAAEDWEELSAILGRMNERELHNLPVLKLRQRLAEASGREELAKELGGLIRQAERGEGTWTWE